MMGQIILVSTLVLVTVAPIMYVLIRALLQEKQLNKVKLMLFGKEQDIDLLNGKLDSIKDLTKEQLIEENKRLKSSIQDFIQLRQLDSEEMARLNIENEELRLKLDCYKALQYI